MLSTFDKIFAQKPSVFLLILICPFILYGGSILEVKSFASLQAILEKATSDDLILFDVDNTLLTAQDKVLRPCGKDFFWQQFQKWSAFMPEQQLKLLGSLLLLQRSICLIDAQMPSLIRSLQKRSVKMIALTSLFTGSFGAILSMEEWRKQELKSLDFDFSAAFPHYNYIVFGDMIKEGSSPIFKDGILFSARYSKGEALQAFLRYVKWQPKRIFFIDDLKEHVDSVYQAMTAKNIDCVSMHYRAETLEEALDETIASYQFDYLHTHEKWLSDSEARKLATSVLSQEVSSN